MAEGLRCGIWKHYKGQFYLVLGVGFHTETEERLVVYVPLYVREGPRIACRPYADFVGLVYQNEACNVPRFEYVGEEVGYRVEDME